MEPQPYLEVADDLTRLGGPGHLRSAVSRAYYAVYHAATIASTQLGASPSHSHDEIGNRFQTSDDPVISSIGQRFLDLKSARQRADYELRRPVDVEDAAFVAVQLREARELHAVFGDLPIGGWREAAQRAVRAYDARARGRRAG